MVTTHGSLIRAGAGRGQQGATLGRGPAPGNPGHTVVLSLPVVTQSAIRALMVYDLLILLL